MASLELMPICNRIYANYPRTCFLIGSINPIMAGYRDWISAQNSIRSSPLFSIPAVTSYFPFSYNHIKENIGISILQDDIHAQF